MAYPFGGQITFAQYQQWAREQGCDVSCGVNTRLSVSITRIVAPSGNWVIEAGVKHSDHLVPTTIGRLDRRLGLKSPFFSVDDPAMDD